MGKVVNFSLEAGGRGARWRNQREVANVQAEIHTVGGTIGRRAQYFVQNSPFAAAGVAAIVSNIVGPGIKPLSRHPARATRERLHAEWARWIDECDATGQSDFYGLEALIVREMAVEGESFIRFTTGADGFPLLQVLHADQVGGSLAPVTAPDGIEHDDSGRPVAYHVLPRRISDWSQYPTPTMTPVRIPAADIAHVFCPIAVGQRRGLSWLAPVLLKIREYDGMDDAALASARVRNLVSAIIRATEGEEQLRDAAEDWVPGAMISLAPGEDVTFIEPKESDAYPEFMRTHLRAIAIGLGVPYEVISGDLSQVNYSSIRAGMVEFRKRLHHWQHNIVGRQLLRPVWRRFCTAAMLAGVIPPAKLQECMRRVEFQPPKQEWVDPLKDVQASVASIDAGLTSRSAVISEMGYDPEVVDAEIAEDNARAEALGILQVARVADGGTEDEDAED